MIISLLLTAGMGIPSFEKSQKNSEESCGRSECQKRSTQPAIICSKLRIEINNRTRYEICSKLTIKIFIDYFEHISNLALEFVWLTLNM